MTIQTSRLAAVLLCLSLLADAAAATGSATRTMAVDDSIAGIVGQVIAGAVSDVFASGLQRDGRIDPMVYRELLESISLRIDDQPRTGIIAWLAAINRVAGYVCDRQTVGSIQYSYSVRLRGYVVQRETRIANDSVFLTTSTGWTETVQFGRLTRRIPIHVAIRIEAIESAGKTLLVGTATGWANLSSFRCGLVRRIAEQRAAAEFDAGLGRALRTIQREGTDLYQHGASDVLHIIHEAIQIGKRVRR